MRKVFICILLLISSCSTKVEPKLKPELLPIDNRRRWLRLAPYVKEYFDTNGKTVEEIAADLALAEYLMFKD